VRLYFDTAYLAKCYLNEADSKAVLQLAKKSDSLYSSAWAIAEFSCVIQRHIREGSIDKKVGGQIRHFFLEQVRSKSWTLLPITETLLHRIEERTATLPPEVFLRAGDALHLVTASDAGFTEIWSNDRHLLAAAPYFGLLGRSISV
jgi:predicted nucleic acid-binding protein